MNTDIKVVKRVTKAAQPEDAKKANAQAQTQSKPTKVKATRKFTIFCHLCVIVFIFFEKIFTICDEFFLKKLPHQMFIMLAFTRIVK